MEYPHSNQCTESDFFILGPFGPHLDTKPNLREEQRDCLSSTRYDILTWSYELLPWTYHYLCVCIPYPLNFGQKFALMKPVDSEHKRHHVLKQAGRQGAGKL